MHESNMGTSKVGMIPDGTMLCDLYVEQYTVEKQFCLLPITAWGNRASFHFMHLLKTPNTYLQ